MDYGKISFLIICCIGFLNGSTTILEYFARRACENAGGKYVEIACLKPDTVLPLPNSIDERKGDE